MKYEDKFENEHIEFKSSLGQLDRAIESISAMLNKSGHGKVVFGVDDDANIIGVKNIGKETTKKISTRIIEAINPVVYPNIENKNIDGKEIIELEVYGDKKPYSCFGIYLIRVGSENRKILREDLGDLFLTNSSIALNTIESINQNLTFDGLKSLYISKGFTPDHSTFAANMGLLTKNGKYNYIAEILSDNNNCSIKVTRFKGIDKNQFISRNEFGYKCLLIALKQAYDYVTSFNETKVNLTGKIQRDEIKLFDEKAFNEAWTNACLHNRWSRNISPQIYLYDDRIEIVSTGGLPLDCSKEEFFKGISHPINMSLMKIMGQLDFIEQTGHGVPYIVSKYGTKVFTFFDNHILVTIPFAFTPSYISINTNLSESANRILKILNENPTISTMELAKISNLGKTRVIEIIKELKEKNIITRVGNNKDGYYKVVK